MPRVTNKRIETTELQGEGSYVVFRRISHGASKKARRFLMVGNIRERSDLTVEEIDKMLKEEEELTLKFLLEGIVEWNWKDENNVDLQIPKTVEDLDTFTSEEIQFLTQCCAGIYPNAEKDLKN